MCLLLMTQNVKCVMAFFCISLVALVLFFSNHLCLTHHIQEEEAGADNTVRACYSQMRSP